MVLKLTNDDKKLLLKLARDKITSIFDDEGIVDTDKDSLAPIVKKRQGCFVTLTLKEELRGCIGTILPHAPLYEGVLSNAEAAAFNDPRFAPLTKNEFENPEFNIEISVLTVPFRVHYKTIDELKDIVHKNKDGIILRRDTYESTFLPQVWKQVPDFEEFFSSLSLKAGMDKDDWKEDNVEIYNYQVTAFSERDFN